LPFRQEAFFTFSSVNYDCFNSSQFHLLALRTRSIPRSKSSVNSNLLLLSVSAED
jgi:hypothetical protein